MKERKPPRMGSSSSKGDGNSLSSRRWLIILKWVLYVVLGCVSFAIMETPNFFTLFGVHPLLLIPLSVAVTVFEGEMAGGFYAIFAGFIWSSNGGLLFWGFHTILLYFCAVLSGLLVRFYFRANLICMLLLTAISASIYLLGAFFVGYGMWNYAGNGAVFSHFFVPLFFATLVFSLPFYFLVKGLYRFVRRRTGIDI